MTKKKEEKLKVLLKNNQIVIEKKYGFFIINNKYYEFDSRDGSLILKPVDAKKMKKKLGMVKRIAKELKNKVDGEKILTETLMINLNDKDIEKLGKMVFHKKRNYKINTREHHCVDMKIGNMIIPIVD